MRAVYEFSASSSEETSLEEGQVRVHVVALMSSWQVCSGNAEELLLSGGVMAEFYLQVFDVIVVVGV